VAIPLEAQVAHDKSLSLSATDSHRGVVAAAQVLTHFPSNPKVDRFQEDLVGNSRTDTESSN